MWRCWRSNITWKQLLLTTTFLVDSEQHGRGFIPLLVYAFTHASAGRDSSVGIATRYGQDGPGIESRWGARFSAPVQIDLGAHPASYTMGTGSLPEVKRPGRGIDQPSPSSTEVKERVEVYIHSPSESSWPVLGWPLPLPLYVFASNGSGFLHCPACTDVSQCVIARNGYIRLVKDYVTEE